MPTFFPQIHGNCIMTQSPFSSGSAFETLCEDLESGARFTFPRRNSGLVGYADHPLYSGVLNFSNITDAEVETLRAFFDAMCGKFGRFSFTDPNGNLLKYSERFSNTYWGSGPAQSVADPFGHLLATNSAALSAPIFAAGKGPSNRLLVCGSLFCYSTAPGQSVTLTLSSDLGSFANTIALPTNSWFRAESHLLVSGSTLAVRFGFSAFTGRMFGAQVSPMKGPGAYCWTGAFPGYYENCRFDSDVFEVVMLEPNSNSVRLPVVELNV